MNYGPDSNTKKTIKTPFSWFGGKSKSLSWLLPILENVDHQTFVDVFGGSGTVLWNKNPSPVDVYNDIYMDVVNFFRQLREKPDELLRLLHLTPYSRTEFELSLNQNEDANLEKARKFFVIARQVTRGLATQPSPGRWCFVKNHSRRGMALVVSRWLSGVDYLETLVERLKTTTVENLDWRKLFTKYDSETTLFYLDPPYPEEVRPGGRAYAREFIHADHQELLERVKQLSGKVVLSSYDNKLYNEHLGEWRTQTEKEKVIGNCNFHNKRTQQEKVWIK